MRQYGWARSMEKRFEAALSSLRDKRGGLLHSLNYLAVFFWRYGLVHFRHPRPFVCHVLDATQVVEHVVQDLLRGEHRLVERLPNVGLLQDVVYSTDVVFLDNTERRHLYGKHEASAMDIIS